MRFSFFNIQLRSCSSGDVNELQWDREWLFSQRVKFDSEFNVMAAYRISWHGPKIIHRFTGIWKWVLRWWKRPFWFSKKIYGSFSSNWVLPYQSGCSQFLISSRGFDSSICDWKNKFSFFSGENHLFRIESLWVDFPCVHCFQLFKVCAQYVTLPDSTRVQSVSEEQSRKDFLSKLMDSWPVLRSYRMTLNQWTKWNNWSFTWLPKTSFTRRLPIR